MKSGACYSLMAVSSQVGLLRNPFSSQVISSRQQSGRVAAQPFQQSVKRLSVTRAPSF